MTVAEMFINGELVAANEVETNLLLHSRGRNMPGMCVQSLSLTLTLWRFAEPIFLAGLPASVTRGESDKVTPFMGLLDDIRLFSSALSSEEIGSLCAKYVANVPHTQRSFNHRRDVIISMLTFFFIH